MAATRPEPETKAPKRPKSTKKKEDNRLFVRLPPGFKILQKDLIRITSFRDYILRQAKPLVQRITRTKTGIALWPFSGAKAAQALHDAKEAIESHFRQETKEGSIRVEKAEY